ncbi:hypothetical protein Pint_22116 [Pistacia integerrima]|uniref:Uncharacterized protein n=1 Tax=Pistacia integerrima TaxID=434235 RepID=A0ACC0YIW9_9ROSI|nr:hypothetical protein Pint_22116 [Pistacia integerrima]
MPESRDRLVRPVDIATVFAQRRSETLGILRDEPEQSSNHLGSPVTRVANTTAARGQSVGGGRGGSARRGSFVLPAWYPRTPLRDITAVVRSIPFRPPFGHENLHGVLCIQVKCIPAIERRRARLGQVEGLQMESPMSRDQRVVDSPKPLSQYYSSVPKSNGGGELESLTPQKKLLNSIDKVEKVVMEELNKLKRTPSARKAEREKRVRTLMSMR